MEAANTASLLPDVAAAFVNGAHAIDNGLNIDEAIYVEQVEPGSDNPYINIIACRTADLDMRSTRRCWPPTSPPRPHRP